MLSAMSTEPETAENRIVTIIGRPNVGKSALFNRLAGHRVAIVHAEAGVTRDRLIREVNWDGERFELVDTGGIPNIDNARQSDAIEGAIRRQVDAALADTAVTIFVTDTQAGPHPMDDEAAALLRASGRPVVLAANKSDEPRHDDQSPAFERYGFPVFPVSALHNRGIGDLMEAVIKTLPPARNQTLTNPLKVAVVGRPNVGKSSYVNRLLRSDRVIVSAVAGTTRDSIEVPFSVGQGAQARHYRLIDTAGIRRAGKVSSAVERFSLFRAEESIREANVVVLMLNAEQGPTAHDKRIAALIRSHNKGCLMLVNKWDLAEGHTTQRQYGPALLETVPFMSYCPLVFASATSGYNIRRTIETIDHVASQIHLTLPTGVLNRVLQNAYEQTRPPAAPGGHQVKLHYATQTGTDPIRIRIFVNRPAGIAPAYRDYLVRRLREQFGLEGAPVLLQFTGRDREDRTPGKRPPSPGRRKQ